MNLKRALGLDILADRYAYAHADAAGFTSAVDATRHHDRLLLNVGVGYGGRQEIIDALKGGGVSADDIQTANYSIYPEYDYSGQTQRLTGYRVSNDLTVKIRNLDSAGALIPGVTVMATNTGTGIVNTVVTNESGAYQFPALQPGTYKMSAELPGFQTQTFTNVQLGGAQQVRLNFALQVAAAAGTNVEVTVAADTLLATSSNSIFPCFLKSRSPSRPDWQLLSV